MRQTLLSVPILLMGKVPKIKLPNPVNCLRLNTGRIKMQNSLYLLFFIALPYFPVSFISKAGPQNMLVC